MMTSKSIFPYTTLFRSASRGAGLRGFDIIQIIGRKSAGARMVTGFAAFGREGKLKNDEVLAGVAATARAFEDRPTGGREFMQDRFPDLDTGCRFQAYRLG